MFVFCFADCSAVFGKVYVKENAGIVSGLASTDMDIEEKNSGGKALKEDLVQFKTGISHPFVGNAKACSDEEGSNVLDHMVSVSVWDESPQAIGFKHNSVGTVGLIEQRNRVSIFS